MKTKKQRTSKVMRMYHRSFISMSLILVMLVGLVASAGPAVASSATQNGTKCIITYDLNGGELQGNDSCTQEYTVGSPVKIQTPAIKPREGCWLAGFSETGRNDTTVYKRGDIEDKFSGNITLYAVWTPKKKESNNCTITYVLNGGTLSSGSLTQSFVVGETVKIQTPKLKPISGYYKEGYYLQGYTTGSGTVYTNGMTTDNFTDNVVLYAEWVPVYTGKICTITYDLKGGTKLIGSTTQQFTLGETVKLQTPVVEKEGFYLKGYIWKHDYEIYKRDDIVKPSDNCTFYAVWIPKNGTITPTVVPTMTPTPTPNNQQIEIHWWGMGGKDIYNEDKVEYVETYDANDRVSFSSHKFVKEGYTLVGFSTKYGVKTPKYRADDYVRASELKGIDGLYAIWKPQQLNIYCFGDGSNSYSSYQSFYHFTIDYGGKLFENEKLPKPKPGYTRTWYIGTQIKPDPASGKDIKLTNSSGYAVYENKNIYCVDTPNKAYVTLNYGGGEVTSGLVLKTDGKISELVPDFTSRDGYGFFLGWSPYPNGKPQGDNETHVIVYSSDYTWQIDNDKENLTLYAQYIRPNQNLYVDYVMTQSEIKILRDCLKNIYDSSVAYGDLKEDEQNSFLRIAERFLWDAIGEIPFAQAGLRILGLDLEEVETDEQRKAILHTIYEKHLKKRYEVVSALYETMDSNGDREAILETMSYILYGQTIYKAIKTYE